jgi:hypothetical protein
MAMLPVYSRQGSVTCAFRPMAIHCGNSRVLAHCCARILICQAQCLLPVVSGQPLLANADGATPRGDVWQEFVIGKLICATLPFCSDEIVKRT